MLAMNTTRRLYLPLLLALIAGQMLYFYHKLPPLMASHFVAGGVANGFMSRDAFLIFHLGLVGLMLVIFFGVPVLIRFIPVSMINLPHRDYWLAPVRAAESLRYFEDRFNRFGLAVLAFLTGVQQLVYQANLSPDPRLPTLPFFAMLGAFFIALILFLVGTFRRFGKPPA